MLKLYMSVRILMLKANKCLKAKISSIINLERIDKKVSNNQLVCVFEYTWQNAVTKYQKNNINII